MKYIIDCILVTVAFISNKIAIFILYVCNFSFNDACSSIEELLNLIILSIVLLTAIYRYKNRKKFKR
jgi:hypothetical protein